MQERKKINTHKEELRPYFYGSSSYVASEELFLLGMDNPLNFIRTPIEGCNTLVISGPITVPKLFEIKELYQRLDLPKIVIMFGNALSECSLHEQYLGVSVSALDIKVNYWISGSPPEREHLIEVFRSI